MYAHTYTPAHTENLKSDQGFGSDYHCIRKKKKKTNKLGTGEHIGNTMQAQPAKSKLWKTTSDLVSLANKPQRK